MIGRWKWDRVAGQVTWSDEHIAIHADDVARVQRDLEGALVDRAKVSIRTRITLPNGAIRTVELVIDGDGLAGTTRDVTGEMASETRIQFYSDVFSSVQIGLSVWNIDHTLTPQYLRLVAYNPAFEQLAGSELVSKIGLRLVDVFPEIEPQFLQRARTVTATTPMFKGPIQRLGNVVVVPTIFPLPAGYVGLALEDVTARHRDESIAQAERTALEMLASGADISSILGVIVKAIEAVSLGTLGSILLLDETGTRVRHGTAPNLPLAFTSAIDGQSIGPSSGSCGTAAFRREPVFVVDIETDPLWDDYRELARAHGLRSCWSSPILSNDGEVLGTFALYHRESREPDDIARELMKRTSHVTGIVLERRALDVQLRALDARLDAIREDERTSIARDIHDMLGQSLTALKLDVHWLARRITDAPLAEKLADMAKATDEIIRTVRRISADLRPGILDNIGLGAAIEWQAEELQRASGLVCHVHADLGEVQLDRDLATAVFRIFQESLTNITRHSNASTVEILLEIENGKLRLEVADDGIGIPEVRPRATLGILGMSERARRLGGDCTVKRRSPKGTLVTLVTPLRAPSEMKTVHKLVIALALLAACKKEGKTSGPCKQNYDCERACIDGVCQSGLEGSKCTENYHCDYQHNIQCFEHVCRHRAAEGSACTGVECDYGLDCRENKCVTHARASEIDAIVAKAAEIQKTKDLLAASGVETTAEAPTPPTAGSGSANPNARWVTTKAKNGAFAACRSDEQLSLGGCQLAGGELRSSYPSAPDPSSMLGGRWTCDSDGTNFDVTAYALCTKR